jgi:hypothetical protein
MITFATVPLIRSDAAMIAKLLVFWHRKTGPPPDQMSLCRRRAFTRRSIGTGSRYRFKTIHAEPIPDNCKDLGADREPRTNAILTYMAWAAPAFAVSPR